MDDFLGRDGPQGEWVESPGEVGPRELFQEARVRALGNLKILVSQVR